MINESDLYAALLAAAGGVLAAYSYFILGSVPLTALGVGVAVVGASLLITSSESPYRPYLHHVLSTSLGNIARVLEEFGVSSKAIYVPGKDGAYVLVPLSEGREGVIHDFRCLMSVQELTASIDGIDYLVFTSPSTPHEAEGVGGDLEAVLNEVLVNVFGLCDSVKVVITGGNELVIEVSGAKVGAGPGRSASVMGSAVSHVVASVAAKVLDKPVRFVSERASGGKVLITLEVLRGGGGAA